MKGSVVDGKIVAVVNPSDVVEICVSDERPTVSVKVNIMKACGMTPNFYSQSQHCNIQTHKHEEATHR